MLSNEAILYYANHPVEFVQDILKADPDPEQKKILRSLVTNQMTSVRSGHGIGKSAVEAWSVIWFMCTHPYPKIPCTAPTQHQLFDILWAEISKWKRNNKTLDSELIWTKEKLYMKGHAEEWFAVARTASTPDALQGFHAEHMLYIIDEASGVEDKIFEPVLGALSTPGAKLLMCGNPTQLSGFFMIATIRTGSSIPHFILTVGTVREYRRSSCRLSSICMARTAMYSEYVLLVIFLLLRMIFIYHFRWLKKALQQNTFRGGIRRSFILDVTLQGLALIKQLSGIVLMRRCSSSRSE